MAYELGIKDACHKCQNYDTCKAPCAFVAAISDGDVVVNYAKKQKALKNYNNIKQDRESWFSGRVLSGPSLDAGREDIESAMVKHVAIEDACIEDTLEMQEELELDSTALEIFMDVLKHGRDFKRVGSNFGIGEGGARDMYNKCLQKLSHIFNLYKTYKKPLDNLASCNIPKNMKCYLASQMFEEMPVSEICTVLGVDRRYYLLARSEIEQDMRCGDVVFCLNEDKQLVPMTVNKYLRHLAHNPIHKADVKEAQGTRVAETKKRLEEAAKLVAGGMARAEAARTVGLAPHYVWKGLKTMAA